ncbi:DUF5667 domain-containing protein [Streptomyces silvisoli]|uniref:DUF5667 domain-containing protein n=1 Tax=Streptomyces silvisoli TaxID=3034235 RepID=A0ABT5ZTF2_9ACTN|nr:DUF5667 domain-containing protein [Streptomyces silvisoli]MDF3293112.1 DUF5667 domain-containing protein [Streptomyces silvisoli]
MIGQATAHRRANAFAQALESADTREATPERAAHAADRHADPQQGRLLAMAEALADVPRPELDPEVKMVQRAQLIAAMEAALADGSLDTSGRVPEQRASGSSAGQPVNLRRLRPRSRWSRRLAAGGLTVGVAAGAFSGIAAASTDALPGDTLYGLKRGMEDLRLGMTGDDAARGKVLLDMASTRMQEARRLLERGRSGPLDAESVREVGNALAGMHNEVSQGHDLLSGAYQRDGSLAPIETLNAFSQAHRTMWSQLRDKLPPQLHRVGTQVSSVFDAIDQEVAPLQHLLPSAPNGTARDRRTGKPAAGAHHDSLHQESTPTSGSAPQSDDSAGAKGNTPPSSSDSPGNQGLLGGPGLLTSPQGQPSPVGGSTGSDKPQPEASPQPLLPGLPGLPGLGLNGTDTSK